MPLPESEPKLNIAEVASPHLPDFQELLSPEAGEQRAKENLKHHHLEYLEVKHPSED